MNVFNACASRYLLAFVCALTVVSVSASASAQAVSDNSAAVNTTSVTAVSDTEAATDGPASTQPELQLYQPAASPEHGASVTASSQNQPASEPSNRKTSGTLPASASPLAAAGKVALFLVVVLALILALAWMIQKVRLGSGVMMGGSFGRTNQPIRVVCSQSLGAKERIAVVEVAGKQLVLGITPQNINLLTELEQPLQTADSPAPANFAELLKKAVKA